MQRYVRFPNFRHKALTLSYDDGVIYDKKMIDLMSKHGIKGTFNVNSGSIKDFSDYKDNLTIKEIQELYYPTGNEVAIHGKYHLSLPLYSTEQMVGEIYEDRKMLEHITGHIIRGMAYANGDYSDKAKEVLSMLGIKYARICTPTHGFAIPRDWLALQPTCKHTDEKLFELLDAFLKYNLDEHFDRSSALFYMWGHSFEFERSGNWDLFRKFCETAGDKEDVWYATNVEIYDYIKAFNDLDFSLDGSVCTNNSNKDIYFEFNFKNYCVKANSTLIIK